jgi:hypothetical protein
MEVIAGKAVSVDATTTRLPVQITSSATNTLFPAHWLGGQGHFRAACTI